jgi:hypothetical protein
MCRCATIAAVAADDIEKAVHRARKALRQGMSIVDAVDPLDLSGDEWLELRARIGKSVADFNRATNGVNKSLDMSGARDRLLRYMQLHLNEVVGKDELAGVAGIYEWARRVRELRVFALQPDSDGIGRDAGGTHHASVSLGRVHVGSSERRRGSALGSAVVRAYLSS